MEKFRLENFFQHRLSPYIVSAGDCAALILDTKIREPIGTYIMLSSTKQSSVEKPFENETKSFHKKNNYDRFLRLQKFDRKY